MIITHVACFNITFLQLLANYFSFLFCFFSVFNVIVIESISMTCAVHA